MTDPHIIPKILHQLWIGEKPMPSRLMDTWRDKHPGWEYIRWTEEEIQRRNIVFQCTKAIDDMSEINGKADIMRWEILYRYGGVFVDADSICIETLDDDVIFSPEIGAFAGYENEKVRPGLIATGTMGFPVNYRLCYDAIQWILANDVSVERTGARAWKTVGPGLLTRMASNGSYPGFSVFPSYFFLPIHHSGLTYMGHGKVYAYQEWGSTKQNYDIMNESVFLPEILLEPATTTDSAVSVLISSYNTQIDYIRECLHSIMTQRGRFSIEIVWIDDDSTEDNSEALKKALYDFVKQTRWIRIVYKKIKRKGENNHGYVPPGRCMNRALELAKHEIIVKMDSDDIMLPHRISTQLEFMRNHPDCVMCGSNVAMMYKKEGEKAIVPMDNM